MKERRTLDIAGLVLSGCFLLFGGFLILSSFTLPGGSGGYPGAGFFPRLVGIAVVVLAAILLIQTVGAGKAVAFEMNHKREVAGVVALTLAYLLLWGTGFFAIRTLVFVAFFLRFLGQTWKTGFAVSAVLTAGITAAFQYGLNLSLE